MLFLRIIFIICFITLNSIYAYFLTKSNTRVDNINLKILILGVSLFSLSFIYFLYKLIQYPMITINGQSNLLENIEHLFHSHILLTFSILIGYLLTIISLLIGLINIIVQIYNNRKKLNSKNIITGIILSILLAFLLPFTFKTIYNASKKINLKQKKHTKTFDINNCKMKFFNTKNREDKIDDPEIIKTLIENSKYLQELCTSNTDITSIDIGYSKEIIENLYKLLKGQNIESLNLNSDQLNKVFVAAVELKINRLFYQLSSYMALSRSRLESLLFEYYDYHRVNILNVIIKTLFSNKAVVLEEINGNFDKQPIAISPDYRFLVSYNKNKNNNLMIFNLFNKETNYLDGNYTSDLKITPDNKYIITLKKETYLKGPHTYLKIIDLASRKILESVEGLANFREENLIEAPSVLSQFYTQNLAIAPNGNFFVTKVTNDNNSDHLTVYDIPTGKPKYLYTAHNSNVYYSFNYSPIIISSDNKNIIAIGSPIRYSDKQKMNYTEIVFINSENGKIDKTIKGNFGTKSLAITPNNKYVIVSEPSGQNGLHIIDISTGKTKQIISGYYDAQSIKTTPNSKYALSIDERHGELVIVNLEDEHDIKRVHGNFSFQKIAVAEHSGYYSKYAVTVNSYTHNLAIIDIESGEVNYFEGNFYYQDIVLKGDVIISVDLSYSKNNNFISRTWNYFKNLFLINNPIKFIRLNLAVYKSVIQDTIVHNAYKFNKRMKERLYNQLTEDLKIYSSTEGLIVHKNHTERIGKQAHEAMLNALKSY